MFGLTRREQRWKAEQKAVETVIPLLTAAIQAGTASRDIDDEKNKAVAAATAPLLARIAELDRSLDVMAQNTEAQAHASLRREIELTEKVEKLTQQLAEAREALEAARNWIAERPDMRQCSAGKIVSELTRALAIRAAIKEQT